MIRAVATDKNRELFQHLILFHPCVWFVPCCPLPSLLPATVNMNYKSVDRQFLRGYGWHVDEEGRNALMHAAYIGSRRIVKLCLRNGIDADAVDNYGQTALHQICALRPYPKQLELAEYIIRHGGTVDTPDTSGATALHIASMHGRTDLISLLVDEGYQVNLRDYAGYTPLHAAVAYGHLPAAKTLVERGADVLTADNKGVNLLHEACSHGFALVVSWLVHMCQPSGMYINTSNTENRFGTGCQTWKRTGIRPDKPPHLTMTQNYQSTLQNQTAKEQTAANEQLMLELGMETTSQEAIDRANHADLGRPLQEGDEGWAKAKHRDVGPPTLNIHLQDSNGYSALHYAVTAGDEGIVQELLTAGIDADLQDGYLRTALHYAANDGNRVLCSLLVEADATIDAVDDDGTW